MGLVACGPGIGKKVFSPEEEVAEKIKTEIEAANPGVSNFPPSSTVLPG